MHVHWTDGAPGVSGEASPFLVWIACYLHWLPWNGTSHAAGSTVVNTLLQLRYGVKCPRGEAIAAPFLGPPGSRGTFSCRLHCRHQIWAWSFKEPLPASLLVIIF